MTTLHLTVAQSPSPKAYIAKNTTSNMIIIFLYYGVAYVYYYGVVCVNNILVP